MPKYPSLGSHAHALIGSLGLLIYCIFCAGKFEIDKIVPDAATGENSKVKVKLRVNANGVFTVSEATMSEKVDSPSELENGPVAMDTNQPQKAEGEKMDVDQGSTTATGGEQQQQPANEEEGTAGAANKKPDDEVS